MKVKIIQNEECYAKIESAPPRIIKTFKQELPEGINEGMLCTLGIENEDGVIQVLIFFTKDLNIRRLMRSTDQADPSCFYFRIS